MATLDSIVIQVTATVYGDGAEERLIAQESSDYSVDPPIIGRKSVVNVSDLPSSELANYNALKSYLEIQLNL